MKLHLLFVNVFFGLLISQNIDKTDSAYIKDFLCNDQRDGQSEETTTESTFLKYWIFSVSLSNLYCG